MKKIEKYVLILLILAIFGRLSLLGINTYLTYANQTGLSMEASAFWEKSPLIFANLVNIGALIWLYFEAKAIGLKTWVWATLGLVFGIWGVILFYVIQINNTNLTHHSSGTPNGAP